MTNRSPRLHALGTILLGWWLGLGAALAAPDKQIAITFDDLPLASDADWTAHDAAEVNAKLLATLKQHGVKAVGFVNEDKLYRQGRMDAGIDVLASWLDAGMELGNHNYGHVGLWQSTLAENEEAVLKGEVVTRRLTAERHQPLRYYRHPYTQTGRDEEEKQAFENFLQAKGYAVAPFTVEADDYFYACVYDGMLQAAEPQAARQQVVESYLAHNEVALATFESMSAQLFGRQIPQVLLVHASRLNAQALPSLLALLKQRGYAFVTLPDALADPAYRSQDLASKQFGPSWLARWARQQKHQLTVYGQPDPEGWIVDQAKRLCPH